VGKGVEHKQAVEILTVLQAMASVGEALFHVFLSRDSGLLSAPGRTLPADAVQAHVRWSAARGHRHAARKGCAGVGFVLSGTAKSDRRAS
jgi:hypothetical protein